MCDTNSKAYHDAEQEAFVQIQAEEELAWQLAVSEQNLAEFLSEDFEPLGDAPLPWLDCCDGYSCYCDSSY